MLSSSLNQSKNKRLVECSSEYDYGCGSSGIDVCSFCGNILRSIEGLQGQYTLGQQVYFIRKTIGIAEKGFIVKINEFDSKIKEQILRVKYFEKAWRDDKFDEFCEVNTLFTSIDDATTSMPKLRRQKQNFSSENFDSPNSKKLRQKNNENELNLKIQNSEPKKRRKRRTKEEMAEEMAEVEFDQEEEKQEELFDYDNAKDFKKKQIRKKSLSRSDNSNNISNNINNNMELSKIVSIDLNHIFQEQTIDILLDGYDYLFNTKLPFQEKDYFISYKNDIYIKKGLLNYLYKWACPTMSDAQKEERGIDQIYRKPGISIDVFYEIVNTIPTDIKEMKKNSKLAYLIHLSSEYFKPLAESSSNEDESENKNNNYFGLDLIFVIKEYLEEKGVLQSKTQNHNNSKLNKNKELLEEMHIHVGVDGNNNNFSDHSKNSLKNSTNLENTNNGDKSNNSNKSNEDLGLKLNTGVNLIDEHTHTNSSKTILNQPKNNNSESIDDAVFDSSYADIRNSFHTKRNEFIFESIKLIFTNKKITLPLNYDKFEVIMAHAYQLLGGREAIEGDNKIRGQKASTGIKTMYGGIYENLCEVFIERACMTRRESCSFLDIGCGIGQTCIQVAACVGCKSSGIEVEPARLDISKQLLAAFNCLLFHIGCDEEIYVHFEMGNFMEFPSLVQSHSVIYFNNFGTWFSEAIEIPIEVLNLPGVEEVVDKKGMVLISPMQLFCLQLEECTMGTQVFVLNPLVEASHWVKPIQFKSTNNVCSWSKGPLDIYHYTLVSKYWKCRACTQENILKESECMTCNTSRKHKRQLGGSFTCR